MTTIDYRNYTGFSDPDSDLSVLRDSNGRMRTRSLFHECYDYRTKAAGKSAPPIYTMFENTKYDLPSFWRIYMECSTEYEAAIKLVGNIRHWDALLNCKWFMNPTLKDSNGHYILGLEKWREYKEKQDQALARSVLLKLAQEGNVAAAKALLSGDRVAEAKQAVVKRKREADEVSAQMDSEDQEILKDAKLLRLVP